MRACVQLFIMRMMGARELTLPGAIEAPNPKTETLTPKPYTLAGAIVSQNQKDIARTLGRLILDRHNIYLYADVLDAPDVCWENPDLDPLYR